MIRYRLWLLKKSISAHKAMLIFNNSTLSKSKRYRALQLCGIKITMDTVIIPYFCFEKGNIIIEDNVYINGGCVFLDASKITIKAGALIGPNVTLAAGGHPSSPTLRSEGECVSAPITIGKNVWLGAGTVVLQGVAIGDNSVIGANSVVTKDVPENTLYAGAPAVFKKNLN